MLIASFSGVSGGVESFSARRADVETIAHMEMFLPVPSANTIVQLFRSCDCGLMGARRPIQPGAHSEAP